jgi:hypothetical protein
MVLASPGPLLTHHPLLPPPRRPLSGSTQTKLHPAMGTRPRPQAAANVLVCRGMGELALGMREFALVCGMSSKATTPQPWLSNATLAKLP